MSTPPCNPGARRAPNGKNSWLRLTAIALALASGSVHALSSDRDQAMDITANYQKSQLSTGNDQPGVTHLKGNVRMAQGSLKALADEATMYQHAGNAKDASGNDISGGVKRIVLIGKRAHLEQMQDNQGGLVSADAEKIDYDADTGIAELTGNVRVVQQGRGEFSGAHMIYNTNTGEIESGAQNAGSRVHMIIQPKARTAKPTEAKPEPAPASSGGGTP